MPTNVLSQDYTDRHRKARLTVVKKRPLPELIVRGVRVGPVVKLTYAEIRTLLIGEYQRAEIAMKVNRLIHDIQVGTGILRPISVAVRPDKSRYIVDGQQRYWAAWNCEIGLDAQLYDVENVEAERALFLKLNDAVKLQASTKVKSWPGSAGALMRRLADDEQSPLRSEVGFTGSAKYPASSLVFGLVALVTGGTEYSANIERALNQLDVASRDRGPQAMWRLAQQFTSLLKQVFAFQRAPQMAYLALGLTCHGKWGAFAGARPTARELAMLQKLNWTRWHSRADIKWLVAEILRRWRTARG